MQSRIPLLLLSLTILAPSASPAQYAGALTARNLAEACENLVLAVRGVQAISQEDPGAMLCLGYLAGWLQAMEAAPDTPYCLSETTLIQPGDLADLLVAFIEENPESASAPAHVMMLEAFTETFPCSTDEPLEENGEEQ